MTIDLDPELESRLREEAAKYGLDAEELVLRLIEQSLPARGANQNSLWKTLILLAKTNPYIRDVKQRRRLLEENAPASSMFEGARGLTPLYSEPDNRRSTASRVRTNASYSA